MYAIRSYYACRHCEQNETNTPIVVAPKPNPALPGSLASASTIAYVIAEKYVKGVPLHRQEQTWKQMGVEISRQTMANWIIQSSDRWFSIIYEHMKDALVIRDILHADETSVQVLKEPNRPAESTSYMWLYRTGREGPPIVLFNYQTTRAGKHPKKFLANFKGYLQVDGYEGYNGIPNIVLVGCWAHARRYFVEAIKAMPKTKRDTPTASEEGLAFCNKLFEIERKYRNATPEERFEGRQKESQPVLDEFYKWIKYQFPRILPKSALGKAVIYCRNQWDKLKGFMYDGRLEIDNNRSERSIKNFVIGRKGWLFCATQKGADASAAIYSIVETAKENGVITSYSRHYTKLYDFIILSQ